MNDASILRIAALFSFLSPLAILAGIPLAGAVAGVGGPGPIDFGSAEVLARLAELGSAPVQVDTLALLGPMLALPAGFGWYVLARPGGRSAAFGVLLWYVGMVFIVAQDALQLAFVATLPAAYSSAEVTTRAAIEAIGAALAYAIDVLAFVGRIGDLGFLLLALVMWRCATIPRWIAGLGVLSAAISLVSGLLAFALPGVAWLGLGVPIGILLLLVCIAALGVVMLREASRADARA